MSFELIPDLLADILHEQRITNDRIASLAAAIATRTGNPTPTKVIQDETFDPFPAIDYSQIVTIIREKTISDKKTLVKALQHFGVKGGRELDPSQYPEFVELLA
jgi:hypothetical protein